MVIKAFKAQYRLPMKYQKITSYVGFFGVIWASSSVLNQACC